MKVSQGLEFGARQFRTSHKIFLCSTATAKKKRRVDEFVGVCASRRSEVTDGRRDSRTVVPSGAVCLEMQQPKLQPKFCVRLLEHSMCACASQTHHGRSNIPRVGVGLKKIISLWRPLFITEELFLNKIP